MDTESIAITIAAVVISISVYLISFDTQYMLCATGMLDVKHALIHRVVSASILSVPLMLYGKWLFLGYRKGQ